LLLFACLALLGRDALRDTRLLVGDAWTNFAARIAGPRAPVEPPVAGSPQVP
jgi:hypothetical protein